jgi:hypothetical protein
MNSKKQEADAIMAALKTATMLAVIGLVVGVLL